MTRNEIMLRLYQLRKIADAAGENVMAGQLMRLENDLCNAPTVRNVRLGVPTYTLKMAMRELRRWELHIKQVESEGKEKCI